MWIWKLHKPISFNKLFKLVLGMAVVLQFVVVTYNHFSGYHELHDLTHFLLRIIRGVFYSMIAGFAIAYPDLWVIQGLNRKMPWSQDVLKRAVIQFAGMLLIAVTISTLVTSLAHWVRAYPQGLPNVLFNNMLIYAVVNAFFMSILEAWIYLDEGIKEKIRAGKLQQELIREASTRAMAEARMKIESEKNRSAQLLIEQEKRLNSQLEQRVAERTQQLTETNTQLLKVQKENLQSRFEVLKQQVNPHFLFNSLNVLTSLIKVDANLAESFTEQLSKVYRYVLENKEKDLVSLRTELEFLKAYLFLLEIRFMHKLEVNLRIDDRYHDYQILPIAIQLILENAIKHNTFSRAQPLQIDLFVDDRQCLNIVNNLNVRETKLVSTGVGLENIKRRYLLVSDKTPEFLKTHAQFIARLPLLKPAKSETE